MHKCTAIVFAAAVALSATSTGALADRCSGHSHPAGTILGAAGGGIIGNAVTHGSAVGTVGGVVAGGLAGNAIARAGDCREDRYHHAYYYDRYHHRHYYNDGDWRYYERRHRHHDYDDDDDYR